MGSEPSGKKRKRTRVGRGPHDRSQTSGRGPRRFSHRPLVRFASSPRTFLRILSCCPHSARVHTAVSSVSRNHREYMRHTPGSQVPVVSDFCTSRSGGARRCGMGERRTLNVPFELKYGPPIRGRILNLPLEADSAELPI
eukprot:gene5808-biopygen23773